MGPDHGYCVASYHYYTLIGFLSLLFGAIKSAVFHGSNGQLQSRCFCSVIDNSVTKIVWSQRPTSLTDDEEAQAAVYLLPQRRKFYISYASTASGSSQPFLKRSHSYITIPGLLIFATLTTFIILQFSYICIIQFHGYSICVLLHSLP